MINANELRLGNWVRVKSKEHISQLREEILEYDKIGQVRSIDTNGLSIIQTPEFSYIPEWSYGYVYPIHLTTEVLERCDVKQISKIAELLKIVTTQSEIEFIKSEEKYTVTANLYWRVEFQQSKIKILYLHQLQNLYFAMTGEELQITPI